MLTKTRAIVLACLKHSDKVQIAHLYTREFGRIQYVVYGTKWSRLLTPMAEVEIISKQQVGKAMPSLNNVSLYYVPKQIPLDVRRQCMAMFFAEVLFRTLKHPLQDLEIYDYLSNILVILDSQADIQTLPATFLHQLSCMLGYGGENLEEWEKLKSLDVLETLF